MRLWQEESYILRVVGESAFETGFLIGYKDFRVSASETADVVVTFIHETIREFFAAFYFIAILSSGGSIDSLLSCRHKEDLLMVKRLFLQFCLWFLSDDCWQRYFQIPNRKGVYDSLVLHTAKKVGPSSIRFCNPGFLVSCYGRINQSNTGARSYSSFPT